MKDFFPAPCSSWAEKLAATHPDDLTITEYNQLQAHLASCATCSAIRAEYESMGRAIGQLAPINQIPELSPALSKLFNAQTSSPKEEPIWIDRASLTALNPLRSLQATRKPLRRQISPIISTVAAVLVVVTLLSGFLLLFSSYHSTGTGHSRRTGAWSIIPSANLASRSNALLSITAISANDAWAVGFTSPTSVSQASQTLIEHWNGMQWSVVTSPNSTMTINVLNDVVARSPDDVWAVGSASSSATQASQPLIEHWNGMQWSIVSKSKGAHQQGESARLSRLVALSANNVWGVGTSIDPSGHSTTLIEHWTGTTWMIVPSPSPGSMQNELRGAVAVSANDIWAVGFFANSTTQAMGHTLIEHWDGTRWSTVPSPEVGSNSTVLNAMTAVFANNIWAIGVSSHNTTSLNMGHTLIEHWDGTRWSIVPSPNAGAEENFASLTAIATNDIWAVGISSNGSESNEVQGLTLHWDGGQWTIIPSPNLGGRTLLSSIGKVPGSSSVWAVGYSNNPNTNTTSTLTLRYQ